MKFTVLLQRHTDQGEYFVATCPAIPGCVGDGRTVAEALHNIREATHLFSRF